MNTIDKQMHTLKAQWPSSEILCCQISPDQEAEAALVMLLKRILKWLCGVQAMTLIPGADWQIICSSVEWAQIVCIDLQDEKTVKRQRKTTYYI